MKFFQFFFFFILQILFTHSLLAASKNKILFEENKTQWSYKIRFRSDIGNSMRLFMEKDRFTYVMYSATDLQKIHDQSHRRKTYASDKKEMIRMHAFEMIFSGSNAEVSVTGEQQVSAYHNYFLGNDHSKWASEVHSYELVRYKNLYHGIDLLTQEKEGNFKYDFIVQSFFDPSQIVLEYKGTEGLRIEDKRLIIATSLGEIVESIPYSYQVINGIQREVKCAYRLSADEKKVSFSFPQGYDRAYPLIIDPVLVAATYSGSSAECFGHCAAYDASGNIYTGGECFNVGYPVTTGAFQSKFEGKQDIAISKLNPDGSNLLWATYLGGDSIDVPNSLFIHSNELYVLGASESKNYPTTSSAFDSTNNGRFDIVVTHLNDKGTILIGSTYIGGAYNEGGVKEDDMGSLNCMNYHDFLRGEIIVDNSGNAWIASYTSSADFPTTPGSYSTVKKGDSTNYDACILRLSPDLSTLQWSTFLGGGKNDLAYGIRLNSKAEAYITGRTSSTDFPTTTGSYSGTYGGGQFDGFITHFNATGTALLGSTFFGTSENDISYFIDMDLSENLYIYGNSTGSIPVTPGVFSNPESENFVSKFNPALSGLLFSTVFGEEDPDKKDSIYFYMEPSAFMVDKCENIYLSGFNSTKKYPVTSDALFTSPPATSGGHLNSCYFMALDKNASKQLFGSFYYGDHVDGGTSRFSPDGTIYQGICMSPWDNEAKTPLWAWKNSSNLSYDIFAVKIDFKVAGVQAIIGSIDPGNTVCKETTLHIKNNSTGKTYLWDFGDGKTDTTKFTSHTFTSSGTYTVTLIATDLSNACKTKDTAQTFITVVDPPVAAITGAKSVCPGEQLTLTASGGKKYSWSTGDTTATISVSPTITTTYTVTVQSSVCPSVSVVDTVKVFPRPQASITGPATACIGSSITLTASGGGTYLWNTGSTQAQLVTTPDTSTTYSVIVTNAEGCKDTAFLPFTLSPLPVVTISGDTIVCKDKIVTLTASGGQTYQWSTGEITAAIKVIPTANSIYTVTASTQAGCKGSKNIALTVIPPANVNSARICRGQTATLTVSGGSNYIWSTGQTTPTITVSPIANFTYTVVASTGGCKDTVTSTIIVDSIPNATASVTVKPGLGKTLVATGGGTYAWEPTTGLSDPSSATPVVSTLQTTNYCVYVTAISGCKDSACVNILYECEDIFIPTAFSPNNDGVNELECVLGNCIQTFQFLIYDRWGEKVFETTDLIHCWDGMYKGKLMNTSVFVYYLKATLTDGRQIVKSGNISLIR